MTRTVFIIASALLLGACAGAPNRTTNAPQASAKAGCVTETGTRIEKRDGERCEAGRTYTREDLERSGGITTGEAIRRVQP